LVVRNLNSPFLANPAGAGGGGGGPNSHETLAKPCAPVVHG